MESARTTGRPMAEAEAASGTGREEYTFCQDLPRAAGGTITLAWSFAIVIGGIGVKYFGGMRESMRLEYIVAAWHAFMFCFARNSLRREWLFATAASLITFWPGDTCVTLLGLFRYVEPALFYIGTIPSYMPLMWAITYVLAIHVAYVATPSVPLLPGTKAFITIAIVYAIFEYLEPSLQIWVWDDYQGHDGVPSIVPMVILYESLVGCGYALLFAKISVLGSMLAFGLPMSVVTMYAVSLQSPASVAAFVVCLRKNSLLLWLVIGAGFVCAEIKKRRDSFKERRVQKQHLLETGAQMIVLV